MQSNPSKVYGSVMQLFRYGLAGVIATCTHYLLLVWLAAVIGLPAVLASTVGALGGAITGYLANARWTFSATRSVGTGIVRYMVVAGVALLANAMLLGLLHIELGWPLWPAQLLVTAMLFFTTFVMNRHWSFA